MADNYDNVPGDWYYDEADTDYGPEDLDVADGCVYCEHCGWTLTTDEIDEEDGVCLYCGHRI